MNLGIRKSKTVSNANMVCSYVFHIKGGKNGESDYLMVHLHGGEEGKTPQGFETAHCTHIFMLLYLYLYLFLRFMTNIKSYKYEKQAKKSAREDCTVTLPTYCHAFLCFITNNKSHKYEKHSKEIC